MTEPVKKSNTSAWMTALKQYNQGKQWCVPKKDTPEYEAVKKIADDIKATLPPKVRAVPASEARKKTRASEPTGLTITIPPLPPSANGASGNELPPPAKQKRVRRKKVVETI